MNRLFIRLPIVALCAGVVTSCGGDTSFAPPTVDMETLYWSLQVDYPAIQLSTVAPYNTVKLSAIPHTPDGRRWTSSMVADSNAPNSYIQWTSSDSVVARVSADGLVTAIRPTNGERVYIVATRQIQDITHIDSALVQIDDIATPPILDSFSIQLPDSLKRAGMSALALPATILDAQSQSISGLPVHYRISKPELVYWNDAWDAYGYIAASRADSFVVTGSIWAYGVAKADTFTLQIGWPVERYYIPRPSWRIEADSTMTLYFLFPVLHLGPGGIFGFGNETGRSSVDVSAWGGQLKKGESVDYIFDDPSKILAVSDEPWRDSGAGNVIAVPGDTAIDASLKTRYRRIKEPGTYTYTVKPFGFRGSIVIHDR